MRPGSIFDRIGNTIAMAGVSFPYFWFGQILILVFAVKLTWFDVLPDGGWTDYVLPGLTLGCRPQGLGARRLRTFLALLFPGSSSSDFR